MHACMPCMEHADGARSSLVCRKTLLSRRASFCREGSIIHQNKLLFCTVLGSESTEKAHITELTSGRSTMHAYMHEHASGRQLSKFDYRRLYLAYGRLHACRCSILGSQHYM